jgi:hypothetical protein
MSAGPVRKIVFTGDFLRPSAGGLRPTQHENIHWLARVLETPLRLATGLPSEMVHWDNNWINGARFEAATVQAIYEAFWLKPRIAAWPRIYAAEALPAAVEALLLPLFEGSFVVGFELPPYLTRFLNRHGIGFVDCMLSPVRFMDDLLFEVSASSEAVTAAIRRHAVPEALIALQAGVLGSHIAKENPQPPRPGTLLLLMQTSFDKVVIHEGRFSSVLDHFDALRGVAEGYRQVLIKEHPQESRADIRDTLLKRLPGSAITTDNFYRLVAHHNLHGVAALSSSCVREAGYFGKAGHYLLPGFSHACLAAGIEGCNIDDVILTPDFWRDIIAAAGCPVTPKDGLRLPARPNRFRQQLRSAWGYNQVDTDIFVRWAKG